MMSDGSDSGGKPLRRRKSASESHSPRALKHGRGPCCVCLASCSWTSSTANAKSVSGRTGHQTPPCTIRVIGIILRTLGLVVLYGSCSIGITFYQKWFIQDFHFPLTVVICHLVVKFTLSWLVRCTWELWSGRNRIVLDWPMYIKKLAPTGVASALDIGFSNWSFEFVTISLYTMTKSTCIIFILGFSLLFGLERKHYSLVAVVLLIASGLFMFTYHSTQFNWEGFILLLSASVLAGLRWTLSQLVMQRKEIGLSNPIDMIYHVQPWMIVGLLPLAIAFEGIPIATTEKVFRYKELSTLLQTGAKILAGGILAFFLEVSEYLLLTFTSSLTLSITGIIKEVFTLYLAFHYNGDQLSTINFLGLVICLCGIGVHILLKTLNAHGILLSSRMTACISCPSWYILPPLAGPQKKRSKT